MNNTPDYLCLWDSKIEMIGGIETEIYKKSSHKATTKIWDEVRTIVWLEVVNGVFNEVTNQSLAYEYSCKY